MVFNTPDRIADLTPNSPFDRLPDGLENFHTHELR